MSQNEDKRRAPRVRIAAVTSLETVGTRNANNQGMGVVKNVSRTGIGIETGQPPLRGQLVILRLAIDDVTHELRTHAVLAPLRPRPVGKTARRCRSIRASARRPAGRPRR